MESAEVFRLFGSIGVDTTSAEESLTRVRQDGQRTSSSLTEAVETANKKSAKMYSDMSTSFSNFGNTLVSGMKVVAGVAIGGAFGLTKFVESGSQLQSLRASFQSLTGSVEQTNMVMETLYNYGLHTSFTNQSIQQTAKMFLAAGVSAQNLMGWMKNLGDVAGATGADLTGLALPITQVMAAGVMHTQDWYQVLNQGAGGLKKYMVEALGAGHSAKTFSNDLAKGAVTADVLRKALQLASEKGGMAFQGAQKQANTFKGRMSNLQEAITNVGLAILGVDAKTGQVKAGGVFDRISNAVQNLQDWLVKNKDAITKVANTIIHNFVPALESVATVVAASFIASKVLAFNAAIKEGTTAWRALNLVLTGSPFGILVIAVGALIGALVFLWQTNKGFRDFVINAWAQIKDTLITSLKSVENFFSTAFSDAKKSVDDAKKSFDDAKDAVIKFVNNAIKVLEKGLESVQNWFNRNKKTIETISTIIGTLLLPKLTQLAVQAVKTAIQWAITTAQMAWQATVNFGKMSASAAVQAGKTSLSWLSMIAKFLARLPFMVAQTVINFVKISASAAVQAAKAAARWAVMFAQYLVGVAIMAAQTALAAARMAASWLLAMGPIGLLIALIVGAVALIIINWGRIKTWFQEFWDWIKSGFKRMENAMTTPINNAKNFIKSVVDTIRGFFNFNWHWPHIPLPHFAIKPRGWHFSDLFKGEIPSLGINWYAKGGIMTTPTLFGMNGNNAMIGGEAGPEAVLPLNRDTLGSIGRGIAKSMSKDKDDEILKSLLEETKKLRQEQQNLSVIMDSGELVGAIRKQMDKALQNDAVLRQRGVTI